nr:3'-5' exonuclease [Salinicola sp. DM10]
MISQNRFGVEVICGAAGSGKTSTALLRLRSLCYFFLARNERKGIGSPVKILVLTFNRTLKGYLKSLAEEQIGDSVNVSLEIETFSKWAMSALGNPYVIDESQAKNKLLALSGRVGGVSQEYLVKEAEYLLGRFEPEKLEEYILSERTGRGAQPRVDRHLRRKILDNIIYPYKKWLSERRALDWNGLAISMARNVEAIGYDIVIVDEAQDFSANQIRAVLNHLAKDHTITFVIDTVQKIYARGFSWIEVGVELRPERSHTLRANYRNTQEIAAFASGVLNGIGVEGDGALPNLASATASGALPLVLQGIYRDQVGWAINYIKEKVDLGSESVAFLKPQAGKWFFYLKLRLMQSGITFSDITRNPEWPEGDVNVALSTFHSAKGLEFDYVFIIGFNAENTPFLDEEIDDQVFVLRRLLAVAVARARKAVVIGYKLGEESELIRYFVPGTFEKVRL